MVLALLKNTGSRFFNLLSGKPAASQESSDTEAATKANDKAIAQEGLKPLFIVALPEGDFSELKSKLKEKFNGRDLYFKVDPEIKKPKLYILKPNALAKRNLEIALDKAFIKDNYRSIELSGDANKLGESLLSTMNTEFSYLKGAERKIEYTQKEAEKANQRQSLKRLSKAENQLPNGEAILNALGIHICGEGCEHGGGRALTTEDTKSILEQFQHFYRTQTNKSITSTKQERIKDLQNFLVKLNKLGDNHQTHDQLIKSSSSIYIINDRSKGQTFDPTQLELTFAHREKLSDDFTVHRLPLFDFLRGVELTTSSKRISNGDIHQKEMHAKEVVQAQSSLSVLKTLENQQNPLTALKNNFERNLNQISSKIKEAFKQVQSASQAVLSPITINQGLSIINLPKQGTSFSNTSFTMNTERSQETSSAKKSLKESTKELLRNIFSPENRSFKNSARKVLKTFSPDETRLISSPISQYFTEQINHNRLQIQSPNSPGLRKNLNPETIQNYIDNRVQISQQLNLLPELIDTAFSYDKNLIARFEQSDPATTDTNKQLAAQEYLQNKTNATGVKENDNQVGGIALTGQFSFIDRKEYHERNKTYEDFPELPENWKTEFNSPNTQETLTNHDPAHNTPQDIAQPTKTSTETSTPHTTEAVTNHQSKSVTLAEEENLDREK